MGVSIYKYDVELTDIINRRYQMLPPRVDQYLVEVQVMDVQCGLPDGQSLTLHYGGSVVSKSVPVLNNMVSFNAKVQMVLNGPTSSADVLLMHQDTCYATVRMTLAHTKEKELVIPFESTGDQTQGQCRITVCRVGKRTNPLTTPPPTTPQRTTSVEKRSMSRERGNRSKSKERKSGEKGQVKVQSLENILKNRTDTMAHLMLSLQAQQTNESTRAQLELVSKSHLTRVLQDRISQLTTQNNRLKTQNQTLTMQLEKQTFHSSLRQSTIKKKEATQSQRETRGYKMEILRLQRVNNDWRDRLQQLERDKKRAQDKLQELKKQMDEMVGTNCKLSSSNVKLIKDNLTFRNSLMQKDQTIIDLRRTYDNDRINLQEEIQEINQKYLCQVRKATLLSRQKDDLVQQREALLKKQDQLTMVLSEERQYIDQLNMEKQHNIEQLTRTQDTLEKQNQQYETYIKQNADLKIQIHQLKEQITILRGNNNKCDGQQQLVNQLSEEEREQYNARIQQLQSQVESLNRRLYEQEFYHSEKSKSVLNEQIDPQIQMFNTAPDDLSRETQKRKKCNSSLIPTSEMLSMNKTTKSTNEPNKDLFRRNTLMSYEDSVKEEEIINTAMEEFKVKYTEYEELIGRKQQVIRQMERENNRINICFNECKVKLEVTKEKVLYLEEQLKGIQTKHDKLQQKTQGNGQTITLRQQINELTRSISQEIEQKHELHLQCMDYETSLRHLKQKYDILQDTVKKDKTRCEDMKGVIQAKEQQLSYYKGQVDTIGDEYKKTIVDKSQRIHELQKQIKAVKRQLLNMENIIHERDNIRKRFEQCADEIRSKNEQISSLNEMMAMEREKCELLEATLQRQEEALEENKERLEDMDEMEMQFQSQLEESEQKYQQLQECFVDVENKHVSELKQLNDLWEGKYKHAADETERALAIIEEEREYFGNKITMLENNISKKEHLIQKLQAEIMSRSHGWKNAKNNCKLGIQKYIEGKCEKYLDNSNDGALMELNNPKQNGGKMERKVTLLGKRTEFQYSTL